MESKSANLSYEEVGQGQAIILVHGYPLDHTIWEPVIPWLKDHARLIMPDLRGFGKSPLLKNDLSMGDYADDLLALMDELKIRKAVLAGHSMGGYVCLAFAHMYPNRLAGLALVASHAAADSPEKRQGRLKTADKAAHKGVKEVAETMPALMTADEDLRRKLYLMIMNTPALGVAAALRAMAERPDSTEILRSVTAPAVVIIGKEDKIVPLEVAQTAAQLLPRGWSVEVEGAGHLPMLDRPEVVGGALKELVKAAESIRPEK